MAANAKSNSLNQVEVLNFGCLYLHLPKIVMLEKYEMIRTAVAKSCCDTFLIGKIS